MSTFALDKNYSQFNLSEISVDDLMVISGGSGSSGILQCVLGTGGGFLTGGLAGAGIGASVGALFGGVGAAPGALWGAGIGAVGGTMTGAAASCFG